MLGVQKAQLLFHQRGYDGVSVADLTQALDINPPSLYAAYGSKVGLFERALRRYAADNHLIKSDIFADQELGDAIMFLFVSAAEQYTKDPDCRGCMVTEATHLADPQARAIADEISAAMTFAISKEIRERAPYQGDALADSVIIMLRGLSASAATGMGLKRLKDAAETAGWIFKATLAVPSGT